MENVPLRYSLRQLRYFVVTAEALSFTAAARQLHISQPSISTSIAELEASFGLQLFIRHHASGLSLTPAGRDMLGQARNLLKNAEELQTAARDMDGGMSGTIALGCLVSLAPPLLPAVMSRFVAEHAGIGFRTFEAHQDDLLDGLGDGTLDIALTYSLDLSDEIAFTPLVSLPPYVILPHGHRLARGDSVALEDLLDEPYVLLDLPHSREYFAALFAPLGRRPVPAFRSSQPEVVRGMVANGLGYSILNFPLRSTATVDGTSFAIRPFRDAVTATMLGIAMSRAMKPRQLITRFAEFCESCIPELHGRAPVAA
ncbi:LysR family transcriptional regulator [Burkholderia perseverans]|uniref:LysR family transcriptional regulator n=1 Tax=Burkholderia perseverans TaxID=2615214 RepID=UPI001FEEB45B|nr:LysR family transcriptional regulator [Burkholderia perseverans]